MMLDALKPYPEYKDSGVEWLGEVPTHWEVLPLTRLGHLFKGNGGSKEDEVAEGIPCVRYGDLYTRHEYFIRRAKSCIAPERANVYTALRYGDVLFAASGETIDEIGRSAVNLLKEEARCGGDVLVLRPTLETVPEFLGYASDSPASRTQKAVMGRGFTVVHIYASQLKRLVLALPPLPEQSAIVRFLDYVDRRVRRAIRARQRLVELLEEYKQALIHQAVTGRIDVRTGQPYPEYKDSGVEWLGQVPAHWEVRRLGQIAVSFRTGPFGSILHQADYVEGGTPVINPIHMSNGRIVEDVNCSVPPDVENRLSNYRLEKHDLVFSRRGELGRFALVRDREVGWLCGTGSIIVRIIFKGIEPEYLTHALQVNWVGEYLSLFSVGATMASLNTAILKDLPLLLPPADEQRQLLDCMLQEGSRLDEAVELSRREIELLQEFRTRLIADVVTGKLDVRKVAACLPKEAGEPEPMDELEADAEGGDTADDIDETSVEAEA